MSKQDVSSTDGAWQPLDVTRVAGIPVVTADRDDLVAAMLHDCAAARRTSEGRRPRVVVDLNGQGIAASRTDPAYREALFAADLVHSDGGIWVALSRLTDKAIRGRSCTTDMMTDFAAVCERDGLSFYLVGGTERANAAFADYLAWHYPELKVAGRRNGFFTSAEEATVIAEIDALRPDVVWVGMGKPREQTFAVTLGRKARAGWVVTCGGCYNYFVGGYTRAPLWMRRSGLEWLHRMASDPRRFAWRYITTNPRALAVALHDLVRLRVGRTG